MTLLPCGIRRSGRALSVKVEEKKGSGQRNGNVVHVNPFVL